MLEPGLLQGRLLGAPELAQVRALLAAHPDWSRRQISQQLARLWNWRNPAGQLKDMAARKKFRKSFSDPAATRAELDSVRREVGFDAMPQREAHRCPPGDPGAPANHNRRQFIPTGGRFCPGWVKPKLGRRRASGRCHIILRIWPLMDTKTDGPGSQNPDPVH